MKSYLVPQMVLATKQLLFVIFFIGLFETTHAQFFQNKNCKRELLEKIIEDNRKIGNEPELQSAFTKLVQDAPASEKDCIGIIKYVLLAEISARKADYLNDTSTRLYEQALKLATEQNKPQMLIWASINYAFYLYSYNYYEKALPHFIKTGQMVESFPGSKMIHASDTYKKLAYFTGYIREYENAISYYKKAAKYTAANSSEMAGILDNTGLLYFQSDQPLEARQYFDKALVIAQNIKDTLRQAKVLGNIAALYKKSKDYEKAIALLYDDIELSKLSGNDMNTMFALLRLSEVYLDVGRLNLAKEAALNAVDISQSKQYFKSSELEATELLLQVAQREGEAGEELSIRRKIDSLNLALNISAGNSNITRLNTEAQKEVFNIELNKERERVEAASLVRNIIIVLAVILIAIALIILMKQHNKNKRVSQDYHTRLEQLQSEKINSEARLLDANSSLAAYFTYLSEKNSQIETLEQEIEKLRNTPRFEEDREALNSLLQSHLMTDENWNRFKNAFAREHADYYNELVNNYPGLTEANLRIILLQKLGLSNYETAQLLGITIDAVKKAKQRLKKKLNGNYGALLGSAS